MDDETPPVRRLTLKPKDIVPTDQVAQPGDGTAISVQLIHRKNQLEAERRGGKMLDAGEPHPGSNPRPVPIPIHIKSDTEEPTAPSSEEGRIDIHDMLRANQVAAAETDALVAMPPRRRSRRRQDFALLLGIAICATGALMFVFRGDPQMVGLGMFAIVFVTVILAWVMFGVMDRY